MNSDQRLPGWLVGALLGGTLATLILMEWRWPLRRSVEHKLRRSVRNLIVVGIGAASIQVAEMPVTIPLSMWVEHRNWGLVKWLSLPLWLEVVLAVMLLDYTLYLWHILLHKVPFLWRCHQPHHVDLDMDTSTALRFHFAELMASVPWRISQIALIGVSPLALSVWQTATIMEVMFHHSNLRLPLSVERWLCRLIVTPRMHGIHHSIVPDEQNANWSSGLTLWDWLHGTLRLNVPQDDITIGVPAYQGPNDVTLPKVLAMPFVEQRPTWQLPDDGTPTRPPPAVPPQRLLG
jgi:sterol desaturase/sphingolipid hydroxylase (fatty acid hydroxylase superfamily)